MKKKRKRRQRKSITRPCPKFFPICKLCHEVIWPGQKYLKQAHTKPACKQAKAAPASEPAPFIQLDIYDRLNRRDRMVRSYERVAQKRYVCNYCDISPPFEFLRDIWEGEKYIGEVWVGTKGLCVKRRHIACPYDPNDDLKEEDEEVSREQLPLAA